MAVAFAGGGSSADGGLWFVGAGGGIIAAGLLNLVALRTRPGDRFATSLVVAADIGFAGMFAWALVTLNQPQVIVGLLMFLAMAVLAALGSRRRDRGLEGERRP